MYLLQHPGTLGAMQKPEYDTQTVVLVTSPSPALLCLAKSQYIIFLKSDNLSQNLFWGNDNGSQKM